MYDRIYLGKEFKKQLDSTKCDFGKWYYSFKTDDPELKEILASLEDPHKDLHGSAELILAQLQAGNQHEAEKIFQEKTASYMAFIKSQLQKMGEILSKRTDEVLQEAEAQRRNGVVMTVGAILVGLVIGFVIAAVLTRSITHPINTLTGHFSRVAEGDLSVSTLTVSSRDEIGYNVCCF